MRACRLDSACALRVLELPGEAHLVASPTRALIFRTTGIRLGGTGLKANYTFLLPIGSPCPAGWLPFGWSPRPRSKVPVPEERERKRVLIANGKCLLHFIFFSCVKKCSIQSV